MNDTITCPSGLMVRVRGLKIGDLNIFAEAAEANANKAAEIFDKVLNDCVVELVEAGPAGPAFCDARSGKLSWPKALLTDRFYALVRIRMATPSLGNVYRFKHKCLDCGHVQEVEVELDKLELAMMREEDATKIADGDNRFPGEFSNGDTFELKVFSGLDERQVAKVARKNKDARVSVGLTYRVLSITKSSGEHITDQSLIRAYLDNLEQSELDVITDQIDEIEGGIDSDIEFECDECGSDREARIPFGGPFWISAKKPKPARGSSAFSGR